MLSDLRAALYRRVSPYLFPGDPLTDIALGSIPERRASAAGSEALAADHAAPTPIADRAARPAPGAIKGGVHFDRFALLILALNSTLDRTRTALDAIERIEERPRPGGRGQGLEWAHEMLIQDADRTRQARDLLCALAPHEPVIRALLAQAGEVRA